MPDLLSGLPSPLSHVVHIGAGSGADLPVYLAAGAASVLLVEADPEAAARLEALAADRPGVTVIEAAISADPRRRPFRRANFPELSSFRAPTGLKELFPGLRSLSEDPVAPVCPVRLIEPLDLSADGANLLVIEAPGEALGILEALQQAGLLARFDAVRVQEGREPLYDAAATTGDIRDFLAAAGFAAEIEPAPEDPDRPYLRARLDRAAQAREARIAGLEAERDAARALADALRAERDAARTEVDVRRAERDAAHGEVDTLRTQLAAAQRESEERAEERAKDQAKDWAGQIDTLTGERDAARTEVDEMRAERDAAHAEVDALHTQLAAAQRHSEEWAEERAKDRAKDWAGQIATLTGERDAARTEVDALRAERDTAHGEADDLRRQLAEAQRQSGERAGQIDALGEEHDAVRSEIDDLRAQLEAAQRQSEDRAEERAGDHDAATAKATELQGQLDAAYRQIAERDATIAGHMVVRDEFIKAEGQIDLIKDLLLRGPEL